MTGQAFRCGTWTSNYLRLNARIDLRSIQATTGHWSDLAGLPASSALARGVMGPALIITWCNRPSTHRLQDRAAGYSAMFWDVLSNWSEPHHFASARDLSLEAHRKVCFGNIGVIWWQRIRRKQIMLTAKYIVWDKAVVMLFDKYAVLEHALESSTRLWIRTLDLKICLEIRTAYQRHC